MRGLIDRAKSGAEFGAAFDAVANKRNVSGAVSELQSERGLPSHLLPLGYVHGIQSGHYGPIRFPCSCSSVSAICVPGQPSQTSWALTCRGVAYGTPAYPVITTPVTIQEPAEGQPMQRRNNGRDRRRCPDPLRGCKVV